MIDNRWQEFATGKLCPDANPNQSKQSQESPGETPVVERIKAIFGRDKR